MAIHARLAHRRALTVVAVTVGVLAGLFAWLAPRPAGAMEATGVEQQIGSEVARAADLSRAFGAAKARYSTLTTGIDGLQGQVTGLQSEIGRERTALVALRREQLAAQQRLTPLQALAARDTAILSRQLVASYEAGRPDLWTVVLEADGFHQLLEQLLYESRVSEADAFVVAAARASQSAASSQAARLTALEQRRQNLAETVLAQRNQLARAENRLIRRRIDVAAVARHRDSALIDSNARASGLRQQLSAPPSSTTPSASSTTPSATTPAPAATPRNGAKRDRLEHTPS